MIRSQLSEFDEDNFEKPQSQPGWDREEQVLLIVEYFLYKKSPQDIKKSDVFVSELLRKRGKRLGYHVGEKYRNIRGIQAQKENLSHFDPDYKGQITGHESKWMKEMMNEYLTNSDVIKQEAYEMIKKYM